MTAALQDSSSQRPRTEGPLVEVRDMSVSFGAQHVLRNITLFLKRGQTLAIIGESGCGKTVLMKTMIGLVRPTRGEARFDDRRMDAASDKELAQLRKRLGFVFQGAALFDSMTVAQNIAFPLRQHTRMSAKEIDAAVRSRLADVGLTPNVLEKKPAELSGGMRKRVGLARALAMDPELLLYDEPTTGLDPIMSDVISELIVQTSKRRVADGSRVTSVVVTHDMRSAEKTADRVVMLYPLARLEPDEPQIVYDGPPDGMMQCGDRRVVQFVRGEAGERLKEMQRGATSET